MGLQEGMSREATIMDAGAHRRRDAEDLEPARWVLGVGTQMTTFNLEIFECVLPRRGSSREALRRCMRIHMMQLRREDFLTRDFTSEFPGCQAA